MTKAEASPLQRGKACLRCRKRKMKCNGARPSCQQCLKAGKSDCCEYDDGKSKTRTQLMRETIEKLEQRVRQLEGDNSSSSLVPPGLLKSHRRSMSASSSSSDSPALMPGSPESFEGSPYHSDNSRSPAESWAALPAHFTSSPSPSFSDPTDDSTPIQLASMLLDIFAPHRHQCAVDLHMDRLRASLYLPSHEQRHPALMNSIYLWACFVSRPQPLSHNEQHYLDLALQSINDGLKAGDRLFDVIQGSCIVAMYFLVNGRLLEGGYHASAAAAMAVQCGLNRPLTPSGSDLPILAPFALPPPCDSIEEGERILLFWQCFILDRFNSVLLQKPAIIQDGLTSVESINVPWANSISEYEMGLANTQSEFFSVRSFLGGAQDCAFSASAMRAKATALLHHAHQLEMSVDAQLTPPASPLDTIRSTELMINQYIGSLPPIESLPTAVPDDKYIHFTCHLLAQCAIIRLYHPVASENGNAWERRLNAARECVHAITILQESDYLFLDPVTGSSWALVADILLRELDSINASWPLLDNQHIMTDLNIMLFAMNKLQERFAIVGGVITRLQQRLGIDSL